MTYINKTLQDKFGIPDEPDEDMEEKPHDKADLAKIVPPLKINNASIVIRRFIKAFEAGKLNQADVGELRKNLVEFGEEHTHMPELASARLYEYEALLLDAMGMREDARNSIGHAAELLDGGKKLISDWGEVLFSAETESPTPTTQQSFPAILPVIRKRPFYKRKLLYVLLVLLLIIAWQPIADWYTVVSATPAQKALADSLSLTTKGRTVFLATKPQVVDTDSISKACPSDGTTSLEEGCYLLQTNTIYIRVMPDELKSDETVTAAHEMLHAAYQKYDDSTRTQVNAMVEGQYSSMNDSALNSRVADYNKSEPGAQDAELYAILGTEYGGLSTGLESEYSKYFTDRQTEVNAASQTKTTFDNYISRLDNQKGIIDNEKTLADKYLNASYSWANSGNAYEDDYYYNLYSNEYNNASLNIDSYNQLVDKYNLLVDEYSGAAYTPLSQSQKIGN